MERDLQYTDEMTMMQSLLYFIIDDLLPRLKRSK